MPSRIPPHVAWPAFIVSLFVVGALSTLSMVWIANSDGGAQVIDNYYEKAIGWDEVAARRNASEALNWTVSVDMERDLQEQELQLVIEVHDSDAYPVIGLEGTIRLYRPEIAGWLAELSIEEDPNQLGRYTQDMPFGRSGLWDVEIEATRDSVRFLKRMRTEVR